MTKLVPDDYGQFLADLKLPIRQSQYQALRAANKELLELYWEIGESIHRKQEQVGWGKSVVATLARDLQTEFPGRNGFSAQNLWFMRQFYVEYHDRPKLQSLIREISWTKNLVIMGRCKDGLECEFSGHHLPRQEQDGRRVRAADGKPADWSGNVYRGARAARSLSHRAPRPRSDGRASASLVCRGGAR